MEFIICYTDNKGNNVWEEIIGEDAMQLRIGELADEELHCCTDLDVHTQAWMNVNRTV